MIDPGIARFATVILKTLGRSSTTNGRRRILKEYGVDPLMIEILDLGALDFEDDLIYHCFVALGMKAEHDKALAADPNSYPQWFMKKAKSL